MALLAGTVCSVDVEQAAAIGEYGDHLMERACFSLRLIPGAEAEYQRLSARVWPEITAEVSSSVLRNISGFRRGTDVWYFLEAHPDAATAVAMIESAPVSQRWAHELRDVVTEFNDVSGQARWYAEVFHADGPRLGGSYQRAAFGLAIDPDRAADYDALHANPWPDLIHAMAASGYRNYTGFRRGAHVVYRGDFYPDMATVFAHMAAHDVSGRWRTGLEGIIAMISGPDGRRVIADEFFHQG